MAFRILFPPENAQLFFTFIALSFDLMAFGFGSGRVEDLSY